ncbi:MAG TPA: hypothetical protein VGB17_02950 [Pyrinomonadaceae bacterium]|jgi:hypothetical protein
MAIGITQSKTVYRIGEAEPPVFTATGASGTVGWETSVGELIEDGSGGMVLSLPNKSYYGSEAIVITATDSVGAATAEIDVYALLPYQPDWGFESDIDDETEISIAEDLSEKYRTVSPVFGVYPLAFNDREYDEFLAMQRFWAYHRKTRKFYFENIALGELVLGRFDSALKRKPDSANSVSYSFQFRVLNFTPPTTEEAELLLYGEAGYGE